MKTMKTIKIDNNSYELLKQYCDTFGYKISRLASIILIESLEKLNEDKRLQKKVSKL